MAGGQNTGFIEKWKKVTNKLTCLILWPELGPELGAERVGRLILCQVQCRPAIRLLIASSVDYQLYFRGSGYTSCNNIVSIVAVICTKLVGHRV